MSESLGEIYRQAVTELESCGIDDAKTDAFYLLEHITGISKTEFFLKQNDFLLSEDERNKYQELINRRKSHEPCQYIIGKAWFMGLEFMVDGSVLIPRQDTELLAEEAIKEINLNNKCFVLDLCTGSGILAISIKHYCPECNVCAIDISEDALSVAKENARINNTEIEFLKGNMFAPLGDRQFDVILSNPPYIAALEYENLMPEVREYEPKIALVSGNDGLDHYRTIANKAKKILRRNGTIIVEIGYDQADKASKLFEENSFKDINIIKDLSGKDRVLRAKI